MLKVAQLLHSLVVIFVPVFPNRGVVEPTWDPFIASQPDHDIPRTGNLFGTAWEWSVFPTFASHGLDVVVATGVLLHTSVEKQIGDKQSHGGGAKWCCRACAGGMN